MLGPRFYVLTSVFLVRVQIVSHLLFFSISYHLPLVWKCYQYHGLKAVFLSRHQYSIIHQFTKFKL